MKQSPANQEITPEYVIERLTQCANPATITGMQRFGIKPERALGVSIPDQRKLAKEIGKNHELALELWAAEIHECRIVAGMIDEADKVTEKQMEKWASDFNSWDICDQVCSNLFRKTPLAYQMAVKWSTRPEEFVKRAGFALMACLAVGDKAAPHQKFEQFFPLIKQQSMDNRNFVKKSVNWALRQIGKRSLDLNRMAIDCAKDIQTLESGTAHWIASDAIRELTDERIIKRIKH